MHPCVAARSGKAMSSVSGMAGNAAGRAAAASALVRRHDRPLADPVRNRIRVVEAVPFAPVGDAVVYPQSLNVRRRQLRGNGCRYAPRWAVPQPLIV